MQAGLANQEIAMLNINQRVTAIQAGRLDPDSNRDVLLVGTPTNLLGMISHKMSIVTVFVYK